MSESKSPEEKQIGTRIPDSAAKTLVDDISDIITFKRHLIAADVWEKLEELKAQLEKLRLLMPNFFDTPGDWIDVAETVREIAGIVQVCEDAVDYVCIMKGNPTDSKSCQISSSKRQIEEAGDKVKYINEEIIKKGYQVLHSHAIVNLEYPPQNFSAAPKVGEDHVIGFDRAAAEVLELLTAGGHERLEVVSIVGMLGVGKKTLAKMVYKDPEVRSQFKIRAFVSVSQEFDRREVFVKMLNSINAGSDDGVTKNMDEDELEKQIHQQLEGKQYLIVLCDVWEPRDWDRLKDAFPDKGDRRCRVLLTTRKSKVAEHINTNDEFIYRVDFLTLESSRELLRMKVFGANDCPVELQMYEMEIVFKCDGLPLALLYAATMLVKHRKSVEWWSKVAHILKNYIARDIKFFRPMIYLAYMHLPNHLKPCLLYFTLFPTGFDIPVWKLLRFWIAEGFVLEEEGGSRNLEDIAEQYLEQLVDLNFVMVSEKRSNGKSKTCHMTVPLYELFSYDTILAEAGNLFIGSKHRNRRYDAALLENRRCIGINADMLDFFISNTTTSGNGIRSLLAFSPTEIELGEETVSCIPHRYKLLKVLEASYTFVSCFPDQLWSTLVLLKYLAISGSIDSLPSTLSGLWRLQTLIVKTTSPTIEIKADIWGMPHFRHLHTNSSASFPCRIRANEEGDNSLQTLCYISPECCKKEVFHRTRKLRKLGIRGTMTELFEVGGESTVLQCLHKLEHLENLKLFNCNKFPGLPPNISLLPKQLTKLTLSNTRLKWKEMRALGEMENLEILKLKEYAFVGEQWKTENGGFLRLRHLHIGHMDLTVWEASGDHFPQLRSLEMRGCNKLRRIPHTLADIQSLQSVRLHSSTSPGVTYSLKRIRVVKYLLTNKKTFEISVFPPEE